MYYTCTLDFVLSVRRYFVDGFREITFQKQYLNRLKVSEDCSFDIIALTFSNASKSKPISYSFRGLGFYALRELHAILSPRKYLKDIVEMVLASECVQGKRIFLYVERKLENKKNPFFVYDVRPDLNLPVSYLEHEFNGFEACVFLQKR